MEAGRHEFEEISESSSIYISSTIFKIVLGKKDLENIHK